MRCGREPLLFGEIGRATHVGRARVGRAAGGDATRDVGLAVLAPPARCAASARRSAASSSPRAAGASSSATASSGICASVPMSTPAKVTESASRFSRLPSHAGQSAADHEARDAPLHQRALRRREGLQHVLARAGEGAHVARLHPAAQRRARLLRREAGVHRHGRLLFGVEDPVAGLLRQLRATGRRRRGRGVTRMSRRFWPCQAGGQAAIARSRMVSESSGTIGFSVTSNTRPRPWQCGQAPCGVFGEKSSA